MGPNAAPQRSQFTLRSCFGSFEVQTWLPASHFLSHFVDYGTVVDPLGSTSKSVLGLSSDLPFEFEALGQTTPTKFLDVHFLLVAPLKVCVYWMKPVCCQYTPWGSNILCHIHIAWIGAQFIRCMRLCMHQYLYEALQAPDTVTLHRHSTPSLYTITLHHHSTPSLYTITLHRHSTPSLYTATLHHHSTPSLHTITLHHHSTPSLYTVTLHRHSTLPLYTVTLHFHAAPSVSHLAAKTGRLRPQWQ